ncbi:MAG: transposase [Acidimicrobiia bacterium]|nr:transposase [Acidimicrobiia bacterium]
MAAVVLPEWLLDARTRSERVFVQGVAEAYVRGISTRQLEGLVEARGLRRCRSSRCRSWIGNWTRQWPSSVTGPLMPARTCMCWADALVVKRHAAGRVVTVACYWWSG